MLKPSDIRTIATFLSPQWVKEAAREYGNGHLVYGAPLAFKESRDLCRNYLTFCRQRDKITTLDLRPAQALRACGFAGKVPILKPSDRNRTIEISMWDRPAHIPGFILKDLSDPWEIVPLIGQFFVENPDLNLALLDNQVWQRPSPELMINIPNGDLTQSVITDVRKMTVRTLKRYLVIAKVKFNKARDSELFSTGQQLLAAWMKDGMITSPASAMVAIYPVDALGWNALVPGNGIPWCFCISKKGISWSADHRVFDGKDTARFVKFMEKQ